MEDSTGRGRSLTDAATRITELERDLADANDRLHHLEDTTDQLLTSLSVYLRELRGVILDR